MPADDIRLQVRTLRQRHHAAALGAAYLADLANTDRQTIVGREWQTVSSLAIDTTLLLDLVLAILDRSIDSLRPVPDRGYCTHHQKRDVP